MVLLLTKFLFNSLATASNFTSRLGVLPAPFIKAVTKPEILPIPHSYITCISHTDQFTSISSSDQSTLLISKSHPLPRAYSTTRFVTTSLDSFPFQ